MKALFFVAALFALTSASIGQNAKVSTSDLKMLEGSEWVGSLTYLDYSSNKKTSIKSNLKITRGSGKRSWRFEYIYPDEPKANSGSDIALSKDGRKVGDKTVIERIRLDDGSIRIVATQQGTDNDRTALFKFTYLIGPKSFSLRKEVQVEGSGLFFERNTYSWSR